MSELVPRDQIEQLVGAHRQKAEHLVRFDSATRRVYIMHSVRCSESTEDLRTCVYSRALDDGFDIADWEAFPDRPVAAIVWNGMLVPKAARVHSARRGLGARHRAELLADEEYVVARDANRETNFRRSMRAVQRRVELARQGICVQTIVVGTLLSPDCRDGKHRACDGAGWNVTEDKPTDCPCECHTR